jgi:hypothetical protein
MSRQYYIAANIFAIISGVAAWQYEESVWFGVMVFGALVSIGFFMSHSARIVAASIKIE